MAFGMGGALLQAPQRDDQAFAMKCSAIKINDVWQDVYKDPIGDTGKRSKKGRLALIDESGRGHYKTVNEGLSLYNLDDNILRVVFLDGKLVIEDDFATIRERAAIKPVVFNTWTGDL